MSVSMKVKVSKLKDLVGRKLLIRSFKDGNIELIVAQNVIDGEMFILEEISHPMPAPPTPFEREGRDK